MPDRFEGRSTYDNEYPGGADTQQAGARRFSRQGGRFRGADSPGGETRGDRSHGASENAGTTYDSSGDGSYDRSVSGDSSGFQAVDSSLSYRRSASRYGNQKSRSDRGTRSKSGALATNGVGAYVGYSVADAEKKNNSSRILAIVVGAIAVAVVVALTIIVYNFFQGSPSETQTVTPGIEKEIFVPEGSSTTAIANLLKTEGIVAKESSFIALVS